MGNLIVKVLAFAAISAALIGLTGCAHVQFSRDPVLQAVGNDAMRSEYAYKARAEAIARQTTFLGPGIDAGRDKVRAQAWRNR